MFAGIVGGSMLVLFGIVVGSFSVVTIRQSPNHNVIPIGFLIGSVFAFVAGVVLILQ